MRTLFLSLLLLVGCASLPTPPARPAIETIHSFALQGRLTVHQGESRHHLKIDWHHNQERDEILLSTPLGQGVAQLLRDANGARLVLADQRVFVAEDWARLAQEVLGVRLPLAASSRWLLGETQAPPGWHMRVIERESAETNALPSLIEIERDDIRVRLRIDAWSELQ